MVRDHKTGQTLTGAEQVTPGQAVSVHFRDGAVEAKVNKGKKT
jgi:exonuclease VII large subunit